MKRKEASNLVLMIMYKRVEYKKKTKALEAYRYLLKDIHPWQIFLS